jgi:hypothetical protein
MFHRCGHTVTQCRRQPQLVPPQSKSLDNWPATGTKRGRVQRGNCSARSEELESPTF